MVVVMHTIMAILLAWRLGFAEYVGWLLKSQPSLKRVNFYLFFEDRAHGEPIRAIVAVKVPVRVPGPIQVQIATVVASVGRCRPVVAVEANEVWGMMRFRKSKQILNI